MGRGSPSSADQGIQGSVMSSPAGFGAFKLLKIHVLTRKFSIFFAICWITSDPKTNKQAQLGVEDIKELNLPNPRKFPHWTEQSCERNGCKLLSLKLRYQYHRLIPQANHCRETARRRPFFVENEFVGSFYSHRHENFSLDYYFHVLLLFLTVDIVWCTVPKKSMEN